ncbi:MAG: L-serine ammonia-lyase [Salinivirgaceae bacterium]|jgi:L-serine dehydratase|nr:L-serine ammonia-lyase [Salinivirgaceae bacterium]
MESIRNIYRIGNGPSSSHTMGPKKASEQFLEKYPGAEKYVTTLYGSLAATGKGHLTDLAIESVFGTENLEIKWEPKTYLKRHPNALKFEAFDAHDKKIGEWTAYSIGGGAIVDDNTDVKETHIYPFKNLEEILRYCNNNGMHIWELALEYEDDEIIPYLQKVWEIMKSAVERGLKNEGVLPSHLKLPRKAASYFIKANAYKGSMKKRALVFAYALAVSEENAAGGKIVTGPTCGSAGVMPSVLYYLKKHHNFPEIKIIRALATAGIIGAVVKMNASISGAEVGCQGEIGTACAMASAATTQLFGGTIFQVENSAEMGLEHHLGLTCDPVAGLVQIPCIERNAFAAARALNHNAYAMLNDGRHRISFDKIVQTMKQTGHDLPHIYKETSTGGLALFSGMAKDE